MSGALAWLIALVLPWAYVLPADRVLSQVVRAKASSVPITLQVSIEGIDPTWPSEVKIDVHPVGGVRVDDQQGGRWVLRRGRVIAANRSEIPAWLPQLEPLVLPSVESLSGFLEDAGVNIERSELARCGADDCFVIGGRDASAQFWVEKDGFEPRAWVLALGRRFEWDQFRSWGKIKFPSQINILDESSRLATLRVRQLDPAPQLVPDDFSDRWTRL